MSVHFADRGMILINGVEIPIEGPITIQALEKDSPELIRSGVSCSFNVLLTQSGHPINWRRFCLRAQRDLKKRYAPDKRQRRKQRRLVKWLRRELEQEFLSIYGEGMSPEQRNKLVKDATMRVFDRWAEAGRL